MGSKIDQLRTLYVRDEKGEVRRLPEKGIAAAVTALRETPDLSLQSLVCIAAKALDQQPVAQQRI